MPRQSIGHLRVEIDRRGLIRAAAVVGPYAPLVPPASIVGRNVAELVTEPEKIMAAIHTVLGINAPMSVHVCTVNGPDIRHRMARLTPDIIRGIVTARLHELKTA